jgi:hypothetical protein
MTELTICFKFAFAFWIVLKYENTIKNSFLPIYEREREREREREYSLLPDKAH